MSSLRKKTLHGMQWTILGAVGNAILQMVVMVVITRLVVPAEFGVLAMAQLFVQFAAMFANFSVATAILRKDKLTDEYIAAGFWCGMAISFLIALIMFFLAPYSIHLLDVPKIVNVVRLLSLNFLLNGFVIVSGALLQRQMRFGFLAVVTLLSYAAGYGLIGIPLAMKGFGVYALVLCMLAQTVFSGIMLTSAARHRIKPPANIKLYKDILSFGGQSSLAGLFSFAGSSVDGFMMGHWGGAEILGIYSRSSQLINYPIQVFSLSVTRVLFPGFASFQSNTERMRAVYKKSMEIMAFVLIPIACFATFTSKELIFVAFGAKWESGWPAFVAYAWVAPLGILCLLGMMTNDLIGKQWYRIRIHLEALVVFIVAIGIGLRFGIAGVSIGVVCGHLYRLVFTGALMGRLLQLRRIELLRIFAWPFAAGGVVAVVPALLVVFGGNLTAGTRLLLSVAGGALSAVMLVVSVPIPPLLNLVSILEEGHPFLKPVLKWIRRK